MLSKSKGQILRVAAVLHVLFHLDSPDRIPSVISVEAMNAADNLVSICMQHASYIAGRGLIEEAIQQAELREYTYSIRTLGMFLGFLAVHTI